MGVCGTQWNNRRVLDRRGVDLGGDYSSNNCNGTEVIIDGVSNPLIGDYAWYCETTMVSTFLPIAQKITEWFCL